MKTLYLDCGMGASGDMLTAALLELLPEPDVFLEKLNALGIPGVQIEKEKSVKCGITGTHMVVTIHGEEEGETMHGHSHESGHDHEQKHHQSGHSHDHEHPHESEHHHASGHSHGHYHSGMHEIEHIVANLDIPPKVQEDVLAVYGLIAKAESHAHGVPVTDIHFHEVGTMDAVADITAVCMLMQEISPDELIVSPIHVGCGQVECAHGILPVPAPATAFILKDIPMYGGSIKGELCTPTGAALVSYFADRFGDMPTIKTLAIGYGMGKKDFPAANCVRAILGETADKTDVVSELSCNVDDMTGEAVAFASERLFEAGALDVYTVPIGMKKSRPGILIRVLCQEQDREKILGVLFRHTTTIGVRETVMHRYVLERSIETIQTPYGEVHCKKSAGYGTLRYKYEYEDLARIAREQNLSLYEIREHIERYGKKDV